MSWPASADVPLRHGYTTAQVEELVRIAVSGDRAYAALPLCDRTETAWFGIVECLYESTDRPEPACLVNAGREALYQHNREDMRTHGYSDYARQGRSAGRYSMPAFMGYWITPPNGSPEPAVVERLAFDQIFAELTEEQCQVLLAAANHPTIQAAANAHGMPVTAFRDELDRARLAFLRRWFEHETPRWKPTRLPTRPRKGTAAASDPHQAMQALAKVRDIFMASGQERMFSCDVVAQLTASNPDAYAGWTQRDLAAVMRACGVPARQINIRRGINRKGYALADILNTLETADITGSEHLSPRTVGRAGQALGRAA